MSGQFVTKFRYFWDDADHKLERWLEDMARQGLHLHSVGCIRMRFTFRRGAPAEMTYRLDFQNKRTSPDYVQLFVDAGWERVDHSLGWQFWRIPSSSARTPEIFTDTDSRIRKYQRLLWVFGFSWLLIAAVLFASPRRALMWERLWDTPQDILLTLALIFFNVYPVVRLVLRIRKLRNRAP